MMNKNFREKFKAGGQQGAADTKATSKETATDSNISEPKTASTSKRKKESHNQETTDSTCQNKENASTTGNNVSTSKQVQEENRPREAVEKRRPQAVLEINMQATDLSSQCKDVIGSPGKSDQIKVYLNCQQSDSNVQRVSPKESSKKSSKAERLQIVIPEFTEPAETTKPAVCKSEDTGSVKEQRNSNEWTSDWEENDWSWITDFSRTHSSGWDQLQFDFQHQEDLQKRVCEVSQEEVSQDWINDVSRPRSEWEDLRQARYQEMLDPYFNNDLQQLLQR